MLAQEWLYGNRIPTDYDKYLERHLKLPLEFNPHSSLAVLNRLAERIVFTDDVPSLLYEMHENKQLTFAGVIGSARLPYDCFWLEYDSTTGFPPEVLEAKCAMYGALIRRIGGEKVRMFIVSGLRHATEKIASTGLSYIVDFPTWPPITEAGPSKRTAISFVLGWAFNYDDVKDNKIMMEEIGAIVLEIIFGIFLITQPKVYSVDRVEWKASHKRARAAKGKAPLLEYKRLRIRIGKTHKHYAQRPAIRITNSDSTDSLSAITHRRYHKVMGHFRHYNDHDPPHTTWIEPHYRGDPALGVTFTERDVSK